LHQIASPFAADFVANSTEDPLSAGYTFGGGGGAILGVIETLA
jgi:hypothetical protein